MVCIKTQRATKAHPDSKGTVYTTDGRAIGRVFPEHKDAAGTYGPNGPAKHKFWTAAVINLRGEIVGYLGTRHPDRWSAARAIAALDRDTDGSCYYYARPWGSLGVLARWKREHPVECARPVRGAVTGRMSMRLPNLSQSA